MYDISPNSSQKRNVSDKVVQKIKTLILYSITYSENRTVFEIMWKNMVQPGRLIIIIGIQPLGRSGQRPELSQATGMALVRCILGKFLGVVCH